MVLTTTDAGAAWVTHLLPAGVFSPAAVACPSAATCFVAASTSAAMSHGRIVVTTDGGSTWTAQPLPATKNDFLLSAACPSTSTCYVGGDAFTKLGAGLLFTTSDDGSTWANKTLLTGMGSLDGMACPLVRTCYVAGFQTNAPEGLVAVTSDGGGTWTVTNETNTDGGQGVACAATTTCYALTSGFSLYYTGVVLATTDSGPVRHHQPHRHRLLGHLLRRRLRGEQRGRGHPVPGRRALALERHPSPPRNPQRPELRSRRPANGAGCGHRSLWCPQRPP